MKCNICDASLSEPEYNEDLGAFEPCVVCLDIIYDAAYSDGFEKDTGEVDNVDSSFDEQIDYENYGDDLLPGHERWPY